MYCLTGWLKQGCNFDVKSGDTNSEGELGVLALGPGDERGRRMRRYSFLSDSGVWESVVRGVRSGVQAEKRFYCNLISADRLC